MAILDFLNQAEKEFFSKIFKLEIDYFNRDLNLLLHSRAQVTQPSFDCLSANEIKTSLQKKYVKIVSTWQGDCLGETMIVVPLPDVKIMSGFLRMMESEKIKETLASDYSQDEAEFFKEIAKQINDSMDNALREHLAFDFHATFKSTELVGLDADEKMFAAAFSAKEYMIVRAILKFSDFPDSVITHYIPLVMVKKISELENIGKFARNNEAPEERKKGILIVDDDPGFHETIKTFLKDDDFSMYDAKDGVEAMQVLIRNKVDVIMLDIEMPNMDGFEVCKRIKQNPNTRNTPVIMCSSHSTRDNVLKAVNSGARDFLVKPLKKKETFSNHVLKYIK